MKIRRKTEISVETREVWVFRRRGGQGFWCDACGARVGALSPEAAAAAMRTSLRAVFRRVETGGLHFKETDGGALLICLNSVNHHCHADGEPLIEP